MSKAKPYFASVEGNKYRPKDVPCLCGALTCRDHFPNWKRSLALTELVVEWQKRHSVSDKDALYELEIQLEILRNTPAILPPDSYPDCDQWQVG